MTSAILQSNGKVSSCPTEGRFESCGRLQLILLFVLAMALPVSARTVALWPLGNNSGKLDTACRTDAIFDLTADTVEVDTSTPDGWNLPPNPPSVDDLFLGSAAVRSSVWSTKCDQDKNAPALNSMEAGLSNVMYPTNASFTVEGWIRVDKFTIDAGATTAKKPSWRILVQNGNGSSNAGGWTLSLRNGNDNKGYYLDFYSTNLNADPVKASGDIANYKFIDGSSVVNDADIIGVWHHYVVRFEYEDSSDSTKSRWSWYIDGRQVGTYNPPKITESDFQSVTDKKPTARFDLGGRASSAAQRLEGAFSYWRVSDAALEPAAFLNAGGSGSTVDPDEPLPETTVAYAHDPSFGKNTWIDTGVLVTGESLHHCTFETWVNPRSADKDTVLFAQYSGGVGRSQWVLEKANAKAVSVKMGIYTEGGWIYLKSSRAIPVGRWSHLAFVADGDNWKLFVNGKIDCVRSGFASLAFATDGNNGIVIGNTKTADPNGNCDAYLADSRVWSIARTEKEIEGGMNSRLPSPAMTEGLIGYWPLDDGADSFASMGDSVFNYANINAAIYGKYADKSRHCLANATNVAWLTVGDLPISGILPPKQSAVKFSVFDKGKHSVDTHVTDALKNMTFAGWYLRNDVGEAAKKENYLFAKMGGGNGRCQLNVSNSKLTFWMGGGSNGATNEQFVIDDVSASFPVGKWTYVALVKQGGTFRIFFDGKLEGEFSGFTMDIHPTAAFHVGGFVNGTASSGGYNGFVKDVGIWRKAMTQEEIQQRMYTRPRGTEGSLLGYWPFDDCEGDSLRNLKVNGLAATPVNSTEGHFAWGVYANSPECDGTMPQKGMIILLR